MKIEKLIKESSPKDRKQLKEVFEVLKGLREGGVGLSEYNLSSPFVSNRRIHYCDDAAQCKG